MLRTKNLKLYGLTAIAVVLVMCAGSALAQIGPDEYFVNYYSFAHTTGAPDGKVRIDNPGLAVTTADPDGTLCADVYVFDTQEEMTECCGCRVTADGLRTFSINTNLTGNPSVHGRVLHDGVIKLVSALPNPNPAYGGQCDATGGGTRLTFPNNIVPTADLRAWGQHVQHTNSDSSIYPTTEDAFQEATLTTTELNGLQETCTALWVFGSGTGRCTCGTGD